MHWNYAVSAFNIQFNHYRTMSCLDDKRNSIGNFAVSGKKSAFINPIIYAVHKWK